MTATRFQRFVLPAFAFKAVVIGGGYATGRELAEYFLPSGPRAGLLAMLLATVVWSLVCAVTFLFARAVGSEDYQAFFRTLLGRFAVVFEATYILMLVLFLAVFGAAAGALAEAALGWPPIAGTLLLIAAIAWVATFGNTAVERLFKYVSVFLYATYAIFLALCLWRFGDRIAGALSVAQPVGHDWPLGGLTYAGYNIVGAVVILPVTRHLSGPRDAVVAGLLCGPFAMLPALLFLLCMTGFYPEVASATLPSDFLLRALHLPAFRLVFQGMIFAALLESGTGFVHAVNERAAHAWEQRRHAPMPRSPRLLMTLCLLVASVFLARRFGLVALIASGYRALGWVVIGIYVLPLLTVGVWRLRSHTRSEMTHAQA